jgi:hypothetical protein
MVPPGRMSADSTRLSLTGVTIKTLLQGSLSRVSRCFLAHCALHAANLDTLNFVVCPHHQPACKSHGYTDLLLQVKLLAQLLRHRRPL